MWQTIIEAGSPEGFEKAQPTVDDIPAGSPVEVYIGLQWYAPFGKLADLAGAEWWASKLGPAGMRVTDVYGNWHWMRIKGVATGVDPVTLAIIVVAGLAALGLAGWIFKDLILRADIGAPPPSDDLIPPDVTPPSEKKEWWKDPVVIGLVAVGAILLMKD